MDNPNATDVTEINGFFRDGDSFGLIFEGVRRGVENAPAESSPLFVFSHDQLLVLRDAVDKAVALIEEDQSLESI